MANLASSENGIRVRPPDRRSSSRRCLNCGGFVTARFARVFGDNTDEVHGCIACLDRSAVRAGNACATEDDELPRNEIVQTTPD
ncbi:hypothetical protein NKF26_12935 [Haladaptatus sp. AB618]|uniref:DUF7563 family protein n=1 Tax=Haladaptatus sp. AB618 TaxID=2934173 RepID=UPI00209BE6AB|nr:hypothetical protein [Haladaptatus sp. AB618]MCO8254705.1 hypothetical protein [Haladaptatus sp. AB618]